MVDGEGSFAIIVTRHKTKKTRQDVRLCFQIELRADDRPILEIVKKRLECGRLINVTYERYGWKPHVRFYVQRQNDIFCKIIPFFKQYPMPGKKNKDFILFCQAAELFKQKKHLTEEGINQLLKIREFMNERRPMYG
ncbi:LAGLIDADG family homing endonuclease [Candidatus Amesbacteria bacterium]|nr:LAGLIDADG family homing endonuclease [Candidatus Amesbacteria bacterium]MBI2587476.1 LAGLIDADG family homing endonuclease [Candidatus Amesbacteria bacterium]